MKKEILIYSAIYSYSVADIITQLEGAKDSDIKCRVNSPGGEVYYAYGLIAKYQEHTKKKLMQVDGIAASAAAFLCCCSDEVECLDVSSFLFHRAAFPSWFENDPVYFTEAKRKELETVNAQLRAIMEGVFTADLWEKVTGVSLDDLFSLESRIDVTLDAKQAKKLGLVKKINSITPEKKAEIESLVMGIAAMSIPKMPVAENEEKTITEISKPPIKMTIEKLRAEHPEVYAAVVKIGETQERDRVEAFMEFVDIDVEAVKTGITGGAAITNKMMASFARKGMAVSAIAAIKTDNAPDVDTPEQPLDKPNTAASKEVEAFEKTVRANLKLEATK